MSVTLRMLLVPCLLLTLLFSGCGGGGGGSAGDKNDPAMTTDVEQMKDETGNVGQKPQPKKK